MRRFLIILTLLFVVENTIGQVNYHLVIWDENHEELDIRKPISRNKKVEIASATYEVDVYHNSFKILEMEVLHFRGKKEISKKIFTNGYLDLSKFDAKCGDGFSIKLISVRKTAEEGSNEILHPEEIKDVNKFFMVFVCE